MGLVHLSVWDSFVPDFNHSVIQQPQKSSLLFSTRGTSCTCFTRLPGSRAKPLALDPVKLPGCGEADSCRTFRLQMGHGSSKRWNRVQEISRPSHMHDADGVQRAHFLHAPGASPGGFRINGPAAGSELDPELAIALLMEEQRPCP